MGNNNRISFTVLGGGGEVGANCFLVSVNGAHILLDCGTHPKKEGLDALPAFALLRKRPDALLISHGHVDHCGAMPYLHRMFSGIYTYATLPTARIMDRMLHNSVAVMETISKERGVADYPLYDHEDVGFAMRHTHGVEFGAPFILDTPTPVSVRFQDAGHVLGSASVLLQTDEHTLFYTGDICETDQELMGGYLPLPEGLQVDTLVIESTHGSTEEAKVLPYQEEALRLGRRIAEVLNRGGVALLPSFALGRTQEMLNVIARLQEEGIVPDVPVYASGLGRAIYELYARYDRYLGGHANLRPLDMFGRVGNVWGRGVVEDLLRTPSIIVATSGMMLENTPSALIAERMVRETHHGIFFVGYVDHETLGYQVLHAQPGDQLRFRLGGPAVELRLENIQRFHFSAHAARSTLRNLIDRIRPRNVVFVHGDPDALMWMENHTSNGYRHVTPAIGQTVNLTD